MWKKTAHIYAIIFKLVSGNIYCILLTRNIVIVIKILYNYV